MRTLPPLAAARSAATSRIRASGLRRTAMGLVLAGLAASAGAGQPLPPPALEATAMQAVQQAQAWLQAGQPAAALARASAGDSFHPDIAADTAQPDGVGERHIRFDRRYHGLPVIGGDVIVHLSPQFRLLRVSGTLDQPLNLGVAPALSKEQAQAAAEALFQREGRVRQLSAELSVVRLNWVAPQAVLAWVVDVRGTRCGQASVMRYYVDALTGEVRTRHETNRTLVAIECEADANTSGQGPSARADTSRSRERRASPEAASSGPGKSLYYGTQTIDTDKLSDTRYLLRDTTRGSHFITDFALSLTAPLEDADNTWGSGTTADRATVAVDAAYGQRMTWEYFKTLGRNGIANNGLGFSSNVHWQEVPGTDVDNAQWDGQRMQYGDGKSSFKPLVSLDIAGHEMTHGVTQFSTAKLIYAGESGGLNEATSDIFGTMVEYFANHPSDPPDYLIGEKVMKSGKGALRYMYKPSTVGLSNDCWYTGTSGLEPHHSSGIGNHFFYLLAEGSKTTGMPASPICQTSDASTASDAFKISGIGRAKAEKIWYHALTTNMTSNTTFAQAREATLNSTKSLHGDDSNEYRAVDFAWLAVNVADVRKITSFKDNYSWQTAQIVDPDEEVVVMGRPGVAGQAHWYAVYLLPGKSLDVSLVAADSSTNFNLVAYDTNGTTVLKKSNNGGGAKETMNVQNTGTTTKLIYVAAPYVAGKAPHTLRLKRLI